MGTSSPAMILPTLRHGTTFSMALTIGFANTSIIDSISSGNSKKNGQFPFWNY